MIAHKSTGENNLSYADKLESFLKGIDDYITLKNLAPTKFNAEFAVAETFSLEQMAKLTREECFDYAYMLYQYADHVASERASHQTIVNWCESNLNAIIASEIQDMAGEYLKHDIKVATIIRQHELARKINEWKLTAQARLEPLKGREYNIRKKADILIEKGRKK